jgi:transposase
MVDYEAMSAKKNAPRWIRQLKLIGQWPDKTSALASA